MAHGYETGQLNLPFVGMGPRKRPMSARLGGDRADVAVLGAPFDGGTQFARRAFGPRAIREASTLFSFGHGGAYDHEDDIIYLEGVRIVDIGDADIVHTDTAQSHAISRRGARDLAAGRSGGAGGRPR